MLTLCGSIGSEIADLADSCLNIGQVQKLLFTRKFSSGSTVNKFVLASANPNALASWSSKLSASDGTKVVVSPKIHEPVNEEPTPIEYGSGNEVAGGIPILMGYEPGSFTCKLLYRGPATEAAFKSMVGETLTVYMVAESGKIYGKTDDLGTPTEVYGIDIQQFRISDRILGGRNAPDYHIVTFFLPFGWSEKLYEISPSDFEALSDLAN